MPPRPELNRADAAQAAAHGHIRDHEFVPMWLLVLCSTLLVAVLGLGSYFVVESVRLRSLGPTSGSDVEAWQAEVDRNPSNVNAILGLGYAYQLDGQYEEALKRYEQVLSFNNDDLAALYNSGLCQLELGRDDEGVASLLAVLDKAPGHTLASLALGEYYLESGDYAQTVSVAMTASAKHPEVADLKLLYAKALEKTGRFDEAAQAYEDALRVVPDMPEARKGLDRVKAAGR